MHEPLDEISSVDLKSSSILSRLRNDEFISPLSHARHTYDEDRSLSEILLAHFELQAPTPHSISELDHLTLAPACHHDKWKLNPPDRVDSGFIAMK